MEPFQAVFHAQNDVGLDAAIEMLQRKLLSPYNYPPGLHAQRRYDAAFLSFLKEERTIREKQDRLAQNPLLDEAERILRDLAKWPTEKTKIQRLLANLKADEEKEFEKIRLASSHAVHPEVPPDNSNRDSIPMAVARALNGPAEHPTMSFEEAAHAVGKSASTVRKWCDSGKLKKRSGRVVTASVKAYLETEPAD